MSNREKVSSVASIYHVVLISPRVSRDFSAVTGK